MDFKGFDRDLEDFDKINSLIEKYNDEEFDKIDGKKCGLQSYSYG